MFENYPYTNFHDLNLDWIIQKVKEAYSPDNPPEAVVLSVNGESGDVILYKDAVITLPAVEENTWNIHRLSDGTSTGIQFIKGQKAQRIDGTNRYDIYDQGNPPEYPVNSVNGQTGNVVISIPVTSVNGQTGNVILYPNAVIQFPDIDSGDTWEMKRVTEENNEPVGIAFTNGEPMQRVQGETTYDVYDEGNPPPYPVTSVGTLTGAVAILDTTIVTDDNTQKIKIVFPVSSVDGQTGAVKTWANNTQAMLKTPEDAASDAWGVLRGIPSGDLGIRFEYDSVNDEATGYIYFNDGVNTPTKLKILTPADIPSSTGVISINGMAGVVSLTGNDIPMAGNDARTVKTAVYENESNIGVLGDDIADQYSNSATYAVGDYVIHDNALYKCNTAITTAEAWTAAHWTAVALADEVQTNTQAIADTAADLAQLAGEVGIVVTGDTAAVNVSEGQYVIVQDSTISGITDGLYKAAANVSSGTPFVSANLTAVSGGLGAEVTSLSDQIAKKAVVLTPSSKIQTTHSGYAYQLNGILYVCCDVTFSQDIAAWETIYTVPFNIFPSNYPIISVNGVATDYIALASTNKIFNAITPIPAGRYTITMFTAIQ